MGTPTVSYSYGDMRIAMNTLMINKWRSLGNYQSRYVPGMIGPFLKVSLIPHTSKPVQVLVDNWIDKYTF